jgi:hypothetical protein
VRLRQSSITFSFQPVLLWTVLRGAEQIFSRSHPVVICEVHHRQAEEEVCRWLSDRGYFFEWLDGAAKFPRHLLARPILDASLRSAGTGGNLSQTKKSPTDS